MSRNSYTSDSSTAEAPPRTEKEKIETGIRYSARDEARQLLDEIAGVAPAKRRKSARLDGAKLFRNILFSPFILLFTIAKLITSPFRRADFALFREMRKFLAHPGNFFWFNRLAPQAAAQHFGTSSTEAMTHHARRYAAHMAVLGLAIVVVLGGGFGGAVRQLISRDVDMPGHSEMNSNGYLTVTGNMKGIVLNSLGTTDNGPKRVNIHIVQPGDTLPELATKNNISLDTILYANQIDDPDYELNVGDKLIIPPVTGMWHVTTRNTQEVDTISTIAFRFGVDPKVIINYAPNQLDGIGINTPLEPGRSVMVPGGIKPIRDTLILYKVRDGETLDYIASKFGVTKETIATFNDDKIINNQVSGGMELVILPISGIRVTVQPGDSVTTIANRFKVPAENITGLPMNNVTKDTKLKVGDKLVIPNGLVPAAPVVSAPVNGSTKPGTGSIKDVGRYIPPPPVPAVNRNPNGALSAPPPGVPVGTTGKMVWPVYGPITTYFGQRIWYGIHQGLDIAAPVNTPIVAADGGVVLNAGWSSDGYGIMVLIAHSNGLYTLYGHLNRVNVTVGQRVARGQLIGVEGSTGNSTGPHLHFEVRWGRVYGQTLNPLAYLK